MSSVLSLVLFLGAVLLLFFANQKRHQTEEMRRLLQVKEQQLQEQQERLDQYKSDLQVKADTLWQNANRIHLYAMLSKEEAHSDELREKQEVILLSSKEIIEQSILP